MALRLSAVSRVALMLGFAAGLHQAEAQSLGDELSVLLADSPEINSLRNQVYAADEAVNEAYAGFLPTVDISGDTGWEHTEEPSNATQVGEDIDLMRRRVTGTLRQRLFDGWGTQANYDSAEISREAAAATLASNSQDLMFQGTRAYLEVLRAMALIDLAQQNVEVIQTQLNLETERVERGSGITLDELQAKTRLQIAQERKVAFEGTLQQQLARYRRLFGHDANPATMALPPVPEAEIPATLGDAVAIAEAENPQVYGADANVSLAEEARTQARSGYYPTVDLVGRLNWEEDVDGTEGIRRDAAVLVEANWQIFNGFATDAGVDRAAYQYVASVNDRSAVGRIVVRDTELAWEQFMTARERVALLENAVNIAIEVHAARVRLREAGQETVLNVLDAQNDVFNAQINLVGAQFDMYLGVYRLLQAMGRLTPDRVGAVAPEEDVSFLQGDPASFAGTVTSDEATVALVTEPLPQAEAVAAPATEAAVVQEPAVQSVEIVSASEPIAWPEESAGTAEDAATRQDLVASTVSSELSDANLTRSWTFE